MHWNITLWQKLQSGRIEISLIWSGNLVYNFFYSLSRNWQIKFLKVEYLSWSHNLVSRIDYFSPFLSLSLSYGDKLLSETLQRMKICLLKWSSTFAIVCKSCNWFCWRKKRNIELRSNSRKHPSSDWFMECWRSERLREGLLPFYFVVW